MILNYKGIFPNIKESSFIAHSSDVIGRVTLSEDVSVWYGTVIRGDVEEVIIGQRTNVQDNVTIHVAKGFKTTIGCDVTIGHNAIVHACTIGDRVLIGMGAIILDGAVIEDDVIIGAGALIPPGKLIKTKSLVVGSPGKVVRTLRDDELLGLLDSSSKYVKEASEHKKIKLRLLEGEK